MCHFMFWLAWLLLGGCHLGVASLEAGERGMAEVGRREPGINSSLRSNHRAVQPAPPPPFETAQQTLRGFKRGETGSWISFACVCGHGENLGLPVGNLFSSHSIWRSVIKTPGGLPGPFELLSAPLFHPRRDSAPTAPVTKPHPVLRNSCRDKSDKRVAATRCPRGGASGRWVDESFVLGRKSLPRFLQHGSTPPRGRILTRSGSRFYSHRNDASS